jgi:hypothetical protein
MPNRRAIVLDFEFHTDMPCQQKGIFQNTFWEKSIHKTLNFVTTIPDNVEQGVSELIIKESS